MRLRDDMAVKRIGDGYWLMPYGMSQAARSLSYRLNETAAFMARQMTSEITERALIEVVADRESAGTSEVAGDVHSFVTEMKDAGLVIDHRFSEFIPGNAYLDIAGIHIVYDGVMSVLDDRLLDFSCPTFDADETDLSVSVMPGVIDRRRLTLLTTDEFCLYESADSYDFCYRDFERIICTRVTKDFTHAVFLTEDPVLSDDRMREEFFLALRIPFLLAALKDRKVALHCSACADRYGAFLISARSGGGKSTLTDLIQSSYDIRVLNGDLALLGTEDGVPYFYGMPWCGTSGICTTDSKKLTSVTFIHKAEENRIEELDSGKDAMTFLNRIITPAWSEKMLDARIISGMMVEKKVRMYEYFFKKEKEAGKVFYERRMSDNPGIQ